jgi:hypothetical protein
MPNTVNSLQSSTLQHVPVCSSSHMTEVAWYAAPFGRWVATTSLVGDELRQELLTTLPLDSNVSVWELFLAVKCSGSVETRLVACAPGCSVDALVRTIHELQSVHGTVVMRGIAIPRCRGGKGGFGKNLAKKGRLYIKAQRRGETNANLNQLARNLRGERIGDQNAEDEADVGRRERTAQPRQVPQAVEAAYAEVRREHEHKTHEREAFSKIVKEAVVEGYKSAQETFKPDALLGVVRPVVRTEEKSSD